MADYSPLYLPGQAITSTASATTTGGQLMEVSGSGTVAPVSGTSYKIVGVAAFDAAANADVTIFGRGTVYESTASGAITAGAQLIGATGGKVASLAVSAAGGNTAGDIDTAANNARRIVGVALTTAADAATVTWMEI